VLHNKDISEIVILNTYGGVAFIGGVVDMGGPFVEDIALKLKPGMLE
jgi:hypothetical protein